MKLVLQIAAGVVLAWLCVSGIKILTAGAALHALAAELETPPRSVQQPRPHRSDRPTSADLYRDLDADQVRAELEHEAWRRRQPASSSATWSITTTDGRRFEGQGPPPPDGLPSRSDR